MIFVFTRLKDDTTVKIIQWLTYYGKTFCRFNTAADLPRLWNNSPDSVIDPIDSCYFNGGSMIVPPLGIDNPELHNQVRDYIRSEANALLANYLSDKAVNRTFGLSPFSGIKINKQETLKKAKSIGLQIPETAIVTTKDHLEQLKKEWGRIITKSIDNGISIHTEEVIISGQKTEEITAKEIDLMGDTFFPTLIQKLIDKKYEIRVFYFRRTFYSIAIFSQGSKSAQVDWRNNDPTHPNREVPYRLPKRIEEKLTELMELLGLNYGSIDLIYTTSADYCFLEVNPYGQYGFLSASGNYYIEKHIANYL